MKEDRVVRSLGAALSERRLQRFLEREVRRICNHYRRATVALTTLRTEAIRPLSTRVVIRRLERWRRLVREWERVDIAPFEPVLLWSQSSVRVILPPVVESWESENSHYLVDGAHRLYVLRERYAESEAVVLAVKSNDLPPLPCDPSSWDRLRAGERQYPLEQILNNLNRESFRPVSKTLNDRSRYLFETLDSALEFVNVD